MKIFNKKEEKNKVGRPKLADSKLKKNAILISVFCMTIICVLLITCLFDLNIVSIKKLKGNASFICSEMSPELSSEFDDINFYSDVISAIPDATIDMCKIATKDDLNKIKVLESRNRNSIKGLPLLSNVEIIEIHTYDKNVELIGNDNLKELRIFSSGSSTSAGFENFIVKDMPNLEVLGVASNVDNLVLENLPNALGWFWWFDDKSKNVTIKNAPLLGLNIGRNQYLEKIELDNVAFVDFEENKNSLNKQEYYINLNYISIKNLKPYSYDKWAKKLCEYGGESENDCISTADVETLNLYPKYRNYDYFNLENIDGKTNFIVKDEDNILNGNNIHIYDLILDFTYFNEYKIKNITNVESVQIANYNDDYNILNEFSNYYGLYLENNEFDEYIINTDKLISLYEYPSENYNKIPKYLDLSNQENIFALMPFSLSLRKLYLQKGEIYNLDNLLKLNKKYEFKYISEDSSIINNNLKGNMIGETKVKMFVPGVYGGECNSVDDEYRDNCVLYPLIEVYDVSSNKYDVNTTTKVIDANNLSMDLNKIDITADGLSKEYKDGKLYIKDGNIIIDTYTVKNIKKNTPVIEDKTPVSQEKVNENNAITTNNFKNFDNKINSIKDDTKEEPKLPEEINELVGNNEINKITKIIYKNNDLPLIIINSIEGLLMITLLVILIKNYKRS